MSAAAIQCPTPEQGNGRAPRAFTLVELLVVIGIVALLVGILFPVLGRAREHAHAVQCASNIRQIYQGMVMYANENRGVLPIPAGAPDYKYTPSQAEWFAVRMDEYGRLNFREGSLWQYFGSGVEGRQQVFSCPSDADPKFMRHYVLPIADPDYPRNFSYSFNNFLTGSPRRIGPGTGLKLGEIHAPSHKILICEDEMPRGPAEGPVTAYAPNPSEPAGPPIVVLLTRRHLGKANEGFADGHVEAIDPKVFDGAASDVSSIDAWQVYVNVFSDR